MQPARKSHPVMKIMSQSLMDLPAPINISLWWNYGSLLGLLLSMQIMSGILLSMHYSPSTELAFASLIHITRNVNWGWLLHNLHMNGASLFLLCMYIHMARSIYYESFILKETWNIGTTMFILIMMTAFTGYILPWGQMSFWGATVITNIFSAIPYSGIQLVEWLWGGFAVSGPTLNRFFVLHFLLPFITTMMVILHLIMLHKGGSNNPLGISSNSDRIPFHTYFTIKDMMGFAAIMFFFFMVVLLTPNYLGDPENYSEANPLMTPKHIQPEWYFLWLYAILRSIPNKIGGVIALLLAILILYLPALWKNNKMLLSLYPFMKPMYFMMIISWLVLSWIGSCPVEPPFIMIGQLFTLTYFLYFLSTPLMLTLWDMYYLQ